MPCETDSPSPNPSARPTVAPARPVARLTVGAHGVRSLHLRGLPEGTATHAQVWAALGAPAVGWA